VRAASLAGCAIGLYCDGGMSRSLGQEFAPIVRACGNHSLDQPRWRASNMRCHQRSSLPQPARNRWAHTSVRPMPI